jgi:starch synthase
MSKPRPKLRVAFVTAETEHSLVGGLADFSRSLPVALQKAGVSVTRFSPLHGIVLDSNPPLHQLSCMSDLDLFFTDDSVPTVFFRGKGFPAHAVYPVNQAQIYVKSAVAAYSLIRSGCLGHFDLVHVNDWHFAAIAALVNRDRMHGKPTPSVLATVHNEYSATIPVEEFTLIAGTGHCDLPLSSDEGTPAAVDLLSLVSFADAVNTVSPSYSRQLQSTLPALDLLTEKGRYHGILNGIDTEWNPAFDPNIASTFTADEMVGKRKCRQAILRMFRRNNPRMTAEPKPIVAVMSRLSQDKGFDILLPNLAKLADRFLFVIAGSGDEAIKKQIRRIADRSDGVLFTEGPYPKSVAHELYAGSDIFLRPSKVEPCGLSPLYAMKYGTVPVVNLTGGLKDSILPFHRYGDAANGFGFERYDAAALSHTLITARAIFEEKPRWNRLVYNDMTTDTSWERQIHKYLDLYEATTGMPETQGDPE